MTIRKYSVKYTDSSVEPIEVNRKALVQNELDIALFGKRKLEYGLYLNENILNILERFSSLATDSEQPDYDEIVNDLLTNPVFGQLWHNATDDEVSVHSLYGWYKINKHLNISGNSGYIYDGETIPLPLDLDGNPISADKCSFIVTPMYIDREPEYYSIDVSSTGVVTCKYSPVGNSELVVSAYAGYVVLGVNV